MQIQRGLLMDRGCLYTYVLSIIVIIIKPIESVNSDANNITYDDMVKSVFISVPITHCIFIVVNKFSNIQTWG